MSLVMERSIRVIGSCTVGNTTGGGTKLLIIKHAVISEMRIKLCEYVPQKTWR
jgi:hypothetical protein